MREPFVAAVSVWLYVPPYTLNVACGGLMPVLLYVCPKRITPDTFSVPPYRFAVAWQAVS